MHNARTAGVVCASLLIAAAALTGCQKSPSSGTGSEDGRLGGQPSPTRPSGYGAMFLALDECSSRGRETFTEVSCTSEKAAARVVARYDGSVSEGPTCPERTDFVLHISENSPALDEDGDGTVPQGYACMRNLEAPHPGDPGGGGGPRTIVGDCVYSAGRGEVRETSCDGKGEEAPEYRVTKAVTSRPKCPPSTSLYVDLGGPKPVGCAKRV
ncbi:hypothetical protein [Streptomyces himalayensis]|uniref:Lipoprotein n=1 Tax=Streptomyces himalayensis subsp. himalayensis TaxID=2756131 RepID=A0A7W0IC97_9ACTN|nr:hypothetical protein [Streptomyces himalayensis]MBA2950405.1 hypothetical protein [Streptomyces himalayensis subsp. himalayensis]